MESLDANSDAHDAFLPFEDRITFLVRALCCIWSQAGHERDRRFFHTSSYMLALAGYWSMHHLIGKEESTTICYERVMMRRAGIELDSTSEMERMAMRITSCL